MINDANPNRDIDAGFAMFSGHDTPPQHTDGAAIDRHITAADAPSGDDSGNHSTSSDRFATGKATPDRHIM